MQSKSWCMTWNFKLYLFLSLTEITLHLPSLAFPSLNSVLYLPCKFLCSVHLTGEFQKVIRNFHAVQWLGLCAAFIAKDLGSVLGWGTKIPQAMLHGQRKKKKKATEIKVKLFKKFFLIACKQIYLLGKQELNALKWNSFLQLLLREKLHKLPVK